MPDHRKLHHQIRNEFHSTIAQYYREHQARLEGPAFKDEIALLEKLMTNVLAIVDGYIVQAKAEEEQRQP